MNSTRLCRIASLALGAAVLVAACGRQEPPQAAAPAATTSTPDAPTAAAAAPAAPAAPVVSPTTLVAVDLTNNVDASGKIGGAAATTFAPTDKIYALVKSNNSGAGPSTISAHWEYQGGVSVNDATQPVMSAGESVTTFHIEKPSGWPQGRYKVTIAIDGQPVATKPFEVR